MTMFETIGCFLFIKETNFDSVFVGKSSSQFYTPWATKIDIHISLQLIYEKKANTVKNLTQNKLKLNLGIIMT